MLEVTTLYLILWWLEVGCLPYAVGKQLFNPSIINNQWWKDGHFDDDDELWLGLTFSWGFFPIGLNYQLPIIILKAIWVLWFFSTFYFSRLCSSTFQEGLPEFDKDGSPIAIELFGHYDFKGLMLSTKRSDLEKLKLYQCEVVAGILKVQSEKVVNSEPNWNLVLVSARASDFMVSVLETILVLFSIGSDRGFGLTKSANLPCLAVAYARSELAMFFWYLRGLLNSIDIHTPLHHFLASVSALTIPIVSVLISITNVGEQFWDWFSNSLWEKLQNCLIIKFILFL